MFEFKKISISQLLVLSQILSEASLRRKEFVELKFSRYATNFIETLQFLEELKMMVVQEDDLILEPKYEALLNELVEAEKPDKIIKSFIVNCLLTSKASFSNYINNFLSEFQLKNGHYEFLPSVSQRLEYSGLRNFFIDLELIYIDTNKIKYTISDDYLLLITDLQKPKHLSPDDLLTIQHRKVEIGRAAELKIIEYERQRLSLFPQLVYMIEHVALKDVMAGYDIKSFEDHLDEGGNSIPRFIEVKAVSPWDYRFYWSRNEIENAVRYSANYYLYLLPVFGIKEFDLARLKMIGNPYSNVYQNTNDWHRTEELLAFSICEA